MNEQIQTENLHNAIKLGQYDQAIKAIDNGANPYHKVDGKNAFDLLMDNAREINNQAIPLLKKMASSDHSFNNGNDLEVLEKSSTKIGFFKNLVLTIQSTAEKNNLSLNDKSHQYMLNEAKGFQLIRDSFINSNDWLSKASDIHKKMVSNVISEATQNGYQKSIQALKVLTIDEYGNVVNASENRKSPWASIEPSFTPENNNNYQLNQDRAPSVSDNTFEDSLKNTVDIDPYELAPPSPMSKLHINKMRRSSAYAANWRQKIEATIEQKQPDNAPT